MYIEGEIPNVVTSNGNNNGSGFMNGDGWWAIILFALIFGRGGYGFGGGFGGGYGGSGIGENYVLATDFATIERKLDGVNNGLCDGFYAQNTNMLNGFAGIQNALCQGFSGINSTIVTDGYETRNTLNQGINSINQGICNLGYNLQGSFNSLSHQLSDCCCQTQRAIDGVNYNAATNTCTITNAINLGVRDLIDNQNANYRAIHEELVANKIEAKNDRIAELQDQLYKADLKASQAQQSNYITDTIINKLSPCPSPAFIVPNPNCCYDYSVVRNNGCGCC